MDDVHDNRDGAHGRRGSGANSDLPLAGTQRRGVGNLRTASRIRGNALRLLAVGPLAVLGDKRDRSARSRAHGNDGLLAWRQAQAAIAYDEQWRCTAPRSSVLTNSARDRLIVPRLRVRGELSGVERRRHELIGDPPWGCSCCNRFGNQSSSTPTQGIAGVIDDHNGDLCTSMLITARLFGHPHVARRRAGLLGTRTATSQGQGAYQQTKKRRLPHWMAREAVANDSVVNAVN